MTTQPQNSRDVVVFGAGLIGLCTAFSLIRQGHRVTLVEKNEVGAGAARGNAGEVTPLQVLPMPEPKLLTEIFRGVFSNRHYLSISPLALPRLAGFGLGFIRNSTPGSVVKNTKNLDQLARGAFAAFDSYQADGISLAGGGAGYFNTHTSLDALRDFRDFQVARAKYLGMEPAHQMILDDELHEYEPTLDKHVRAGFLAPTERYMDPHIFVEDLHKALVDSNMVTILEHTELVGIEGSQATLRSTTTGEEESISFDQAVVAVGAWSTAQIEGIRGLATSFVTSGVGYSFRVDPEVLPKHLTVSLNRKTIVVPMSGYLRVVGLMDFDGNQHQFKKSRIQHLHDQAAAFIPSLKGLPRSEEWTGPRPMTPNGLPIISRVPDNDRVIVATGHNMHGLSLGPITGDVVTSMVEGRDGVVLGQAINMKPFAL